MWFTVELMPLLSGMERGNGDFSAQKLLHMFYKTNVGVLWM